MASSTGRLAVPLSAGITTANVFDPHRYGVLIEFIAGMVSHAAADSIYSTKETYDSSSKKRIVLVCPIGRYWHTKGECLRHYHFFRSKNGQRIICKRSAIERLFDRTKDTFGISKVPVRGFENVSSYVLACVFVY